jgi:hypothetical protein
MEICYLLAFPDDGDGKSPPQFEQFKGLKDAPYFQPIDIELVSLGEETFVIEGYAVAVTRQHYDGNAASACVPRILRGDRLRSMLHLSDGNLLFARLSRRRRWKVTTS